ncbi:AraC family transcriptional regulator [Streptomyces sp. C1-2]|nr:AraC family transcriptional regulator [Streptomyces sp. C1-2]
MVDTDTGTYADGFQTSGGEIAAPAPAGDGSPSERAAEGEAPSPNADADAGAGRGTDAGTGAGTGVDAGTGTGADVGAGAGAGAIQTFPFDPRASVSGVGIQIGPMGEGGPTWQSRAVPERVHRVDFHVVMLFTGGPVTHMIDFADHEARAGDVLWIRPGQVHRFRPAHAYRGTALTMQPGFLPRAIVEATGLYRYDLPPLLHPDPAQLAGLRHCLEQLEREYVDTATLPPHLHTAVLRHTLTAFLYRLAHLAAGSAGRRAVEGADSAFERFREAVERDFARNHSVSAYADALGYSRRTLVRAVRAATGETPKGFIDKRVVLEAKRLLAHTDLPVGRVGATLGFPDAANFSKFFHQRTGLTPALFRAGMG